MKKPKYIEQVYGFRFLLIGVSSIVAGTLAAIGVMHPTKHSMIQDNNTIALGFYMIGSAFYLSNVVLTFISRKKENQHSELISNNKTVIGTVKEVNYKRKIKFGKTSPYVICFSYSLNGKNYHSKSYLLWEKPNLTTGDSIEVYVNDFGNSTIMV